MDSVSLLPYLETQANRFYLSLVEQPDTNTPAPAQSPFSLVSESAPYSRVFAAALKSDAGNPAARLLLLTQKDCYTSAKDASTPVNNTVIAQYWQELPAACSRGGIGTKPLLLKEQSGPDEAFLPFPSLFYCGLQKRFFPPVCPHCGRLLRLCRDEAILQARGLQSYADTLRRYLFCSSCLQSGSGADFYAAATAADDPSWLIDKAGLIKKMGEIKAEQLQEQSLVPCPACRHRQACYGPEALALSRISVFSFYPFHMFIFNADTIGSGAYAKLMSGEIFSPVPEERQAAGEISIASVLKRILQRWQSDFSPTAAPAPELAATRITAPPDIQKPKQQPQAGQDLAKTHILAPGAAPKGKPGEKPGPPRAGELELEKTRIIAPSAEKPSPRTAGGQPWPDHSGQERESAHRDHEVREPEGHDSEGREQAPEKAAERPRPDDGLEKTVIVSPGRAGQGKK